MVVAVLIEDLFDERELIYPYYRLQEAGAEVLLVGPEARVYRSKSGFAMRADLSAAEVREKALAGLVIPGGYAPDRLRRHGAVLALVRAVDEAQKPLAAICHAGWVLISAGVVRGRRLTGYHSIRDDLENAGAIYLDEAPVVDGHLITARNPADLPVWMAAFTAALDRGS